MTSNSSEPWCVTEQEMRDYERKMGYPMSKATRECLEFEYYQAYLLAQEMNVGKRQKKESSPQPPHQK